MDFKDAHVCSVQNKKPQNHPSAQWQENWFSVVTRNCGPYISTESLPPLTIAHLSEERCGENKWTAQNNADKV